MPPDSKQMRDLAALIKRAQQGDLKAFDAIVRRFQDTTVAYAYSLLGDFHLAEDAAQDALVEAHRNLDRVYGARAFPAWLRKIVYKHCDRLWRKANRTQPLDPTTDIFHTQQSPADMLEEKDMHDRLDQAIHRLDGKSRQVLSLYYMGELSQQQVADFLGLNLSTVNTRLHVARKRLKEAMLEMVQDYVQEQRPSRDSGFATGVLGMIQASLGGRTDTLRSLIRANPAQVSGRDGPLQTTPLIMGAHRGNRAIVALLLEAGADVHGREGASGATALHWAAEGGHLDVAQLLLDYGSDLHAVDDWFGLGPAGWATVVEWSSQPQGDRAATARALLKCGAQLDIFTAMMSNKIEEIDDLIAARPAELDRRMRFFRPPGDTAWSPLHVAATAGLVDAGAALLAKGANVGARTGWGRSPLALAITAGQAALADLLRQAGARPDLSVAIALGDLDLAGHLLAAHKQPGATAQLTGLLFFAVEAGLDPVVDLLLRSGADPNARCRYFFDLQEWPLAIGPLHLAALANRPGIARRLLDAGADPDSRSADARQLAPLHLAAMLGRTDTARVLLQGGAQAQLPGQPQTPLEAADFFQRQETASLLREAGPW